MTQETISKSTMMHRKVLLLSILEIFGGKLTAKKFQKLLFLFIKSMKEETPLYEFAPYKYGCFSFKANMDMISLKNKGTIIIENNINSECNYSLLNHGYFNELNMFERKHLEQIKSAFSTFSQTEIIRYVYTHYPYFAVRSSIAEKILTAEELEKVINIRKKLEKSTPVLFTIGYEGLSLESYIKKLIQYDIKTLVDVRKNAYSMKYGFSKGILSKACEGIGVNYIHIPQLGIESNERQELNTQSDYNKLFDKYEKTTLVENKEFILKLRSIVDSKRRVALTCFEKNPLQCHRYRIAKHLMNLPDIKYELQNI